MDSLCRVRPTVGRSVGPSVFLHYRVRSIHPIQIEGFSSNLAAMGFKYIIMSEIYAVLVLWNITLYYYTLELYSILNHKCGLQCKQGFLDLVT